MLLYVASIHFLCTVCAKSDEFMATNPIDLPFSDSLSDVLTHGLNASLQEVMDTNVCLVTPDLAIRAALQQLITTGAALLVVVGEGERPIGLVTEGDLLPAAVRLIDPTRHLESRNTLRAGARLIDLLRRKAASSEGHVYDVMTHPPVWADPRMTVGLAAALMVTYEQQQLAVVDGARAVGVVTRRDLLTALQPAS